MASPRIRGESGMLMRFSGDVSGSMLIDFSPDLIDHWQALEPGSFKNLESTGANNPLVKLGHHIRDHALHLLHREGLTVDVSDIVLVTEANQLNLLGDWKAIEVVLENGTQVNARLLIADHSEAYFNNDSLLLFQFPPNLIEQTIYQLLPLGFLVYSAETELELATYMKRRHIDYLIWCDPAGVELRRRGPKFKGAGLNTHMEIIAYTQSSDDMVKKTKGLISATIVEVYGEENAFADKVISVLANLGVKPSDKRNAIRIHFGADTEKPPARIQSPDGKQPFDCMVNNLSLRGIGLEFDDRQEIPDVQVNSRVSLSFDLGGRWMDQTSIVTFSKGRRLGLRFESVSTDALHLLSQFIASETALTM